MIRFTRGDILKAGSEALVNTVNCDGFMGRGIALQFKRSFPNNFDTYERACKRGEVQPGHMLVVETGGLTNPKYIVNFPTKRHWRNKSRLVDIDAGLAALVDEVCHRGIRSLAMPALGCGLGGLNWDDVRPLIERAFASLPSVQVLVYEPKGAPEARQMTTTSERPEMTPGRAVLICLMRRYLSGLLDPFVSLLEIHKLMYFMEAAGEPLKLNFSKAAYGPYTEKLRHVLNKLEGHYVTGYADGGDNPQKTLELLPGSAERAEQFLEDHPETRQRFERVATLVDGFETPTGMELLGTVHWVMAHGANSEDEAIQAVHNWSERKQTFTARQIKMAFNVLRAQGWS